MACCSPMRPTSAVAPKARKKMAGLSQASPTGSPSTGPPKWLAHGHGRVLYPLFTILNIVLILLLYYYLWRIFCRRSQRLSDAAAAAAAASSSTASSPSPSLRNDRVNPDVLSSLPDFLYSASGEEKLECVVCLSEFKDGDKGRLLPICGHRFHADCIDMWFRSQSTCPICRSAVGSKAQGSDEAV
ncbi:unnamed protein product [Musa textilis]